MADQEIDHEVAQALLGSGAYDHSVGEIELIQTHISFVFLTGDYVYKVKKPVDFGFLDFTTLEKREFFCNEEMRVNKVLCGDIYKEVVPINKSTEGNIKINGPGETVDFAVRMVQLPGDTMMSDLLGRGGVTEDDIMKITRLLVDFHAKARTGEGVIEHGGYAQVEKNWVENFDQTRGNRGTVLDAEKFDALEIYILNFLKDNKSLIEKRVSDGRVRECHGDCHSGNIFIVRQGGELYEPGIYIFDAIEFYKGFSCSDVANEVAFLAMDLDYNGREDLSDHFVDSYVKESGDTELQGLLSFYKCYRAYVRSKVIGFMLADPNVDNKAKKNAEGLTKSYFDLALKYAGL